MYDGNELISSTLVEREAESENILRPQTLEGSYRSGQGQGKPDGLYQRGKKKKRKSRPRAALRSAGAWKNYFGSHNSQRNAHKDNRNQRTCHRKSRRPCRALSKLTENEVLFIDEIHRLNHSVEEILYPALEDYALDFIIGKGPSAKSIRLSLPRFTLVGATTKAGRLSAPLRDRFGVHARLEMYSTEQLVKIVRNSSKVLETEIDAEAAAMLAGRSRGTPAYSQQVVKKSEGFRSGKGRRQNYAGNNRLRVKLYGH